MNSDGKPSDIELDQKPVQRTPNNLTFMIRKFCVKIMVQQGNF